MIRLGEVPGQYEGLDLNQCGLLFLGTPHSGTVGANWNDLLIELAKIGKVGRGRDFTRMLSAFNQESVGAKERFGLLQPVPPFICVYETQRTPVKGTERTVKCLFLFYPSFFFSENQGDHFHTLGRNIAFVLTHAFVFLDSRA